MEWNEWHPIYLDIVERLELDVGRDKKATELLSRLLADIDPQPLLDRLRNTIAGKTIIVCGAGPSLDRHLKQLQEDDEISKSVIVVADGAVSVVTEQDIDCDIVVTDLDGNLEHLKDAAYKGALLIVHAHGDNMDVVESVVPKLGNILGSTQVEPTNRAFLWGGFTDGDRACYIIREYSPAKIILAGMDFGNTVGKWSKPGHDAHFSAGRIKRIKLEIAEELISGLLQRSEIEYVRLK
ncbi:MAG: 6-hydroxymethylpterin diphosphokinase MptE-like protein [Candidatus Thorarchaeota archaeon]